MNIFTAKSNRAMNKHDERGVLHHVPLFFIVIFGIAGIGYLVYTHAATSPTPEILSGVINKSKWCVNDVHASTAANSPITSAICDGSVGQRWTFSGGVLKNTALKATRCIQPLNGATVHRTKLVSAACSNSKVQQWKHTANPGTFQNIGATRAGTAGLCLSVSQGILGQQLRINNCDTFNAQKWSATTYTAGGGGVTGGAKENIISTLYAEPSTAGWQQVESAAPTAKYAIVNICAPDGSGSGCGRPADEKNPNWVATISALKNANVTPLYYISTNYGAISIGTLESEIRNAIVWYGVASPMFDTMQTSQTCSNGGNPMPCAAYYQTLYNYAVQSGANAVVYNPGVVPSSSFMFGSKEIIQVFEGSAADFKQASFPSWMTGYPAAQFAATLSEGNSSTIGADVDAAANNHIGNFYEDDEHEPPNYSTLPAFWNTEVSDVSNIK